MKKKFTMLFAALLAFVGVAKAQTVVGLTEVPTTAVDLSTTELTTGYYLIKQTNTADNQGFLKAASEADGAVVTPNEAGPTANADTEATYIWYVEVADDGKFSIATANKVAGWQAPTQYQKNLVAYANKATTLELEKDFASLNGTTQTLIKAYWEEKECYSYVHASSHNLGSWNDQNTQSLFYIEFYAIPESDIIIYDPVGIAKLELESYIAEASAGLGSIALQTSDANAAGYLSSCGSADGNVEKNMIDGNNGTFFGSPWQASVANVDYHYWQVDLGDGVSLNEFVFSYVTRANGDDTPYSIVVKGSADGETFNELATIAEGLPQTASASYTSSSISNPSSYRYIRFDVTDARKGSGANPGYAPGSHATQKTFAIAEFALINKDEASWSEQDKAIKVAIDAAQEVLDADDATVETIAEALHNVKMAEMVRPVYPFTVTTDDENPVLYAIKSGRGEAYWYTYDAADGMIALSQYTGATEQMWLFKEVVTEDYQYALQLYPYAAPTKAMSYENTNSNPAKIVAKEVGTEGWINLWLSVSTDGAAPYGLQTYNKANYLSNNGGVTNKMGMWTAAPSADPGTAMYFVTPAEALESLIAKAKDLLSTEGTGVGYCTAESVANLRAAIAQAEAGLEEKNYSVDGLNEAIAALETIQPEAGKFYTIASAMPESDNRSGQSIYVNENGGMQFSNEEGASKLFQFVSAGEGKFYLYNVENGSYLNTAKGHNGGQAEAKAFATDGAKAVTITNMGRSNAVKIVPEGGAMLHAQASGSSVVAWNNDENVGASAWTIVEVEVADRAETFQHTLTVTEAGWATLVLGYNTTIPAEVKAYAVSSIAEGKAVLAEVADVLPAHTPVLIEAAAADYVFEYTATEATVASNLLAGSVFNTNVAPVEGTTNYVLSNNGGVVALYKKTTTNDAGKIVFAANKAYLPVETATEGAPAMFSLGRGEGTTGIETAVSGEQAVVIYDLAGRRVEKMEKGIYIVNGKKVIR